MTEEGILLRASGMGKAFGARTVFAGVSLTVARGQILLIIGPNGAGKSTLLKILCGLSDPSSGTMDRLVPGESTGYIGHSTFIYPKLTALENLRFWDRLYALDRSDADLVALLDRVGLKRVAFEQAGIFSRGMAQRLSLARVLLLEPLLICLDEPSTGLDVASQGLLRREILAARARGAGVAWVSHDVERDLPTADRVLHLENRAAVYSGPAKDYALAGQGGCHVV